MKIGGIVNTEEIESQYRRLQKQSDDALYEAKYLGKNRYSVYSSSKNDKYPEIRCKYSGSI